MPVAGQFRDIATLERPTVTRGTVGQNVTSWGTLKANVRCDIQQQSANEGELARRNVATATHTITLYRDSSIDLKTTDRVVSGSRTFAIGGIATQGVGGVFWILTVTEMV